MLASEAPLALATPARLPAPFQRGEVRRERFRERAFDRDHEIGKTLDKGFDVMTTSMPHCSAQDAMTSLDEV